MTEAVTEVVVPVETAETPVVPTGETVTPVAAEVVKPVDERLFTQAELNAAIEKRLARDRAKRERELEADVRRLKEREAPVVQQKPADPAAPKREDYPDYEAYIDARAEFVADQRFAKRESEQTKAQQEARARQESEATFSVYAEREAKAKEKYADFDEVVRDPSLPITDAMFRALVLSDEGPELAYYLGNNRTEAQRIAALPPIAQAREIGKLEAKLAIAPAPPKPASVSKAPAPIEPLSGGVTQVSDKPPDDPDEYKRWHDERERAKRKRA